MKNYCTVAVVVLLTLSQRLHSVAAEGSGGEEGSPQYMYMERLRKLTQADKTEDAQTPGTLLASSFKDTYVNGGQIGGDSMSSSITLHFTVPQQSGSAIESGAELPILKAELWLFPSFDRPIDDRWYELTFSIVFTLDGFNKRVEAQIENVLWRGSDECVMVDLTSTIKTIDRKLKKKNLNGTIVNAIVTINYMEEHTSSTPQEFEWQTTCSSLSHRTSNTTFLVVKYFTEEENSSGQQRKKRSEEEENSSDQKKRSVEHHQSPDETRRCSPIEFKISLQKAFGEWVASPTELVDVGACSGRCDVTKDNHLFTPRSILKARLRNIEVLHSPMLSHNFEVTCTPLTFEPLRFLIHIEETDSLVLVRYPVKVKTCGCQ